MLVGVVIAVEARQTVNTKNGRGGITMKVFLLVFAFILCSAVYQFQVDEGVYTGGIVSVGDVLQGSNK